MKEISIQKAYQPLFQLMEKEHELTLLTGEMDDIIMACNEVIYNLENNQVRGF